MLIQNYEHSNFRKCGKHLISFVRNVAEKPINSFMSRIENINEIQAEFQAVLDSLQKENIYSVFEGWKRD